MDLQQVGERARCTGGSTDTHPPTHTRTHTRTHAHTHTHTHTHTHIHTHTHTLSLLHSCCRTRACTFPYCAVVCVCADAGGPGARAGAGSARGCHGAVQVCRVPVPHTAVLRSGPVGPRAHPGRQPARYTPRPQSHIGIVSTHRHTHTHTGARTHAHTHMHGHPQANPQAYTQAHIDGTAHRMPWTDARPALAPMCTHTYTLFLSVCLCVCLPLGLQRCFGGKYSRTATSAFAFSRASTHCCSTIVMTSLPGASMAYAGRRRDRPREGGGRRMIIAVCSVHMSPLHAMTDRLTH
jgi:hypothetical protein